MSYVRPNLNEIVAGMPAVQIRVKAQADDTAARIKGIIAPHSKSGHLFGSVKVVRALKGKDQWIHINASYAIPANYGFYSHVAGHRIDGINFIKGAIYGGL